MNTCEKYYNSIYSDTIYYNFEGKILFSTDLSIIYDNTYPGDKLDVSKILIGSNVSLLGFSVDNSKGCFQNYSNLI